MNSRNKERELALICIYDALTFTNMNTEFSLEDIMSGVFEDSYENISIFAKELVIKTLANVNEIIPIFQENMKTWRFSRLNMLEQCILLLSYTNFKLVDDPNIEKGIVIDCAVRFAKRYLDKDDYKFVNAILDKVL